MSFDLSRPGYPAFSLGFIADAINADPAIFQKDLRVQMRQLILDPLTKACETATGAVRATWPRLLVIDGLDECSGQRAQLKVLDVISHLVRHSTFPLAIFLSCRPEAHIRGAFQNEYLSNVSLKICLSDTYNSDHDIRKFLIGKFREVAKAHSHITQDWPGEKAIHLLVEKSSGQFVYASTVIKYINVLDDNPIERLNIVRGLQKSLDDENPFAELDALYKHILASVKPRYRQTVLRVLMVTLVQSQQDDYRYPPPSLYCRLASFLGLQSEELEFSLGNLEGILVEQLTDRPSVKFHHASFGDFLLDENRSRSDFIQISLAYTEYIVKLFHYILNHAAGSLLPDLGSTTTPFGFVPNMIIAIRFILDRLPIIEQTEGSELHQMLRCATKAAASQKIIRSCITTDRTPMLGWYQDLFSWELLAQFISSLRELTFNDAETLAQSFLDEVRKYISQELPKYSEEPLCHLITLFMVDRSIPSSVVFHDGPWHPRVDHFPIVLSRFLIDDHILLSDRTSLNLAPLLRKHIGVNDCDSHRWSLLRHLIQEIGYSIEPEAYSATFLCIMKWASDLWVEKHLFFKYLRQGLWKGNTLLDLCPEVVALWHVLFIFGEPLLGKAGRSVELQKHLIENEHITYGVSCVDRDERRRRKMWKAIKGAIDKYLLVQTGSITTFVLTCLKMLRRVVVWLWVSNLLRSASASARSSEETDSIPIPSSVSGSHIYDDQVQVHAYILQRPSVPRPYVSSDFPGDPFEPSVSDVSLDSGQQWSFANSFDHNQAVHCVNFSHDGNYLAAGCADGKAYIYHVRRGTLLCTLKNLIKAYEYITAVCFNIRGDLLTTGSADGNVYIWEIGEKRVRCAFKGTHWILSLDPSPDGRSLVSTSRDNTVRLWTMRSGVVKFLTDNSVFSLEPLYASAVFSPDGRCIAASHKDGVVRIWEMRTGRLMRRVQAHTDWVYDVGFTADGMGLVSGSRDATLKYWDVSSLYTRVHPRSQRSHREVTGVVEQTRPVREFLGRINSVYSIATSPDGRWVASGSADQGVHIWDTNNAAMQCILNCSRWIFTVAFSPVGGYLASGGSDGTVRLWVYTCT